MKGPRGGGGCVRGLEQLLPFPVKNKTKKVVGVKKEPTDPHKQALSFMASVTPSLLKSDSQVHA